MSTNSASIQNKGNLLRIAVVSLGVVMCLLLFFADKTNLHNQTSSVIGNSDMAAAGSNQASSLPPLAPDPTFDQWVNALERAESTRKIGLLDSITTSLVNRKRFAYASDYASQLVALDNSVQRKLSAGKFSQMATQLDYIQKDSVLFRKYSDRSISLLSEVVKEEPENEEALLYLGLAYTQSGVAQNSMQGILTIRKVLELNPDNIEAGYYLGLFSLQTGQNEKARDRFLKILENAPGYGPARYQLALAYIGLNQTGEARSQLEEIIRGKEFDTDLKLSARELLNTLP